MSQKIVPCLWFDHQAEDAATLYTSLFPNSSIDSLMRYGDVVHDPSTMKPGSVMTSSLTLAGFKMTMLNGGPLFKFTPAISFYVTCDDEATLDKIWAGLVQDGTILMPLGEYPWSQKFGWLQDRFGLTWQLGLGKIAEAGQMIAPFFLFTGAQHARAEEATRLYTSLFSGSQIDGILHYTEGEHQPAGTVKHVQFGLAGEKFMATDSNLSHGFTFNEALSLQILCQSQAEVDHYWASLIADGGEAGPCGWLKDKFGVSWQVTPTALYDMLQDPDPLKAQRATKAMLSMSKFDIAALERARDGLDSAG